MIQVHLLPEDEGACERFLRARIKTQREASILGLDTEWPPHKARNCKVSIVQLAFLDECFVIPIGKMRQAPATLASLLADPAIPKAGVGIAEDVRRLEMGHGLKVKSYLEVRSMAAALGYDGHKRGLSALASDLLDLQMDKQLQCSNWGARTLTPEQLRYAALDAWVSRELVFRLFTKYGQAASGKEPPGLQDLMTCLEPHLHSEYERPKPASTCLSASPASATTSSSAPEVPKGKSRRLDDSRLPTRKSVLYENCRILAPDGTVLSTCGQKKINWYIQRGLATLECEEPLTARLKFEPAGRGHSDDKYYLADKDNRCCVCGREGDYLRHSVVPHCYRQHFPETMRSHLSHDIVLLCVPCKRRCSALDHSRMACPPTTIPPSPAWAIYFLFIRCGHIALVNSVWRLFPPGQVSGLSGQV
ncbi:hypothetical protein CYMTET_32256, partial [Cymbomonas tetramitiformis]